MNNFIFLLTLLISISTFGAGKVLQGDTWKNSALTKTWTPSATAGTLVTAQSVSGDMTSVVSGDLTNFQLKQKDIQTKTANYTALVSDGYINASGSAFTVTLYPASGNSGRLITIKKTDSSLSNIITIDGNASETIDGSTTTTLNTINESVTLYCDGSNWFILNRSIPQTHTGYTASTNGLGTIANQDCFWRRSGDSILLTCRLTVGTLTASEMRVNFPSGVTSSSGYPSLQPIGMWWRIGVGSNKGGTVLIEPSVTYVTFSTSDVVGSTAANPVAKVNGNIPMGNGETFYFTTEPIAVSGWN